jgi:hypothetical protein
LSFLTRIRRQPAEPPAEPDLTPDDHAEPAPSDDAGSRRGWRRVAGWTATALACLLVLAALVAPNQISHLTAGAFLRIPVEGLVGVVLVLVLPAKARRVAVPIVGVALGVLTILKLLDMGFFTILDRPFDPVLDWSLLSDAEEFVARSYGRAAAIGATVAAIGLAIALLVLMTLSVRRLTRLVVWRHTTAIRTVAVLGIVWSTCALLGVQIVAGAPIAARSAATLSYDRLRQVRADLRDEDEFKAGIAVDAFGNTPSDELLTALRGKDVMVAFVESYGRVAVEDPQFAPDLGALLDAGNRRLRAAGFASRSAYLTSPTTGGGSWLAHATLLSGLWINNEQRHRALLASQRLTLNGAFRRANWRTVGVMPAITRAWPEGAFYGYDRLYDAPSLGYRGPLFTFGAMPDQYALSAFQRLERAKPDHAPVMAETALVSSHGPWTPIPQLVDWNAVGDGSVFDTQAGAHDGAVLRDRTRIRSAYIRSIEYSLSALISYVETYGDDNLVLVFLGDHQPAPIVTGGGASRDVPITIVARDQAVLDRISGWGWQDGLKPSPQAPVWRMNAFRDRFLTAFGPPAR